VHAAGVEGDDERPGIGRRGEDAALARYLGAGYRLLARNWTCRLGEIDLLLERGSLLVVCEVKARRGASLGGPFEAVTPRKQEKLRRLAQVFLLAESRAAAPSRIRDVRFDVASVTIGDGDAAVHVYEDAF
jgi:putative endonuclease